MGIRPSAGVRCVHWEVRREKMVGVLFGENEKPLRERHRMQREPIQKCHQQTQLGNIEEDCGLEVQDIEGEMGALGVNEWRVPPCSSRDIA